VDEDKWRAVLAILWLCLKIMDAVSIDVSVVTAYARAPQLQIETAIDKAERVEIKADSSDYDER